MSNTMTPEYVYSLVANNPNLRSLVEQSARLLQMQQQAQQFAPVLNQFARNPAEAVNGYMNWQQQQQAQQNQPAAQPQQQNQGQTVTNTQQGAPINYQEIAQQAYQELLNNFKIINDNIKGLYDETEKNTKRLDAFLKQFETSESATTAS